MGVIWSDSRVNGGRKPPTSRDDSLVVVWVRSRFGRAEGDGWGRIQG